MAKKKAKREIWLSEVLLSRNPEWWDVCSKHFSKSAAMKAADECSIVSCIKHRVRNKNSEVVKVTYDRDKA